jgi:4-hydroxyacetophenone monooxygenase
LDETGFKREWLKAAMGEADLRVLLMVLYQFTADERWLNAPYLPRRDVRLIAAEDAGFPEEVQAEIRAAAVDLLSREQVEAAIPVPDEALLLRMMRICLGENVAPEYAPMMREQMGFARLRDTMPRLVRQADSGRLPVLIVGAGVSGIALGKLLLEQGIDFRIVDKNADLGGTWWENTYPGCGVDTPNHAYSYSFGARYRWSRYFSPREEIQDYLQQTAADMNVRPHMQFQTEVKAARWDAGKNVWRVTVEGEAGVEEIEAMALVSAVGQLNLPAVPDIPGMPDFGGRLFHSSNWPSDLDISGKRVAVIGTGASAMQIVPTIADDVASLTIYQRSPQWARPIPRYHEQLGEHAQWLLEQVPFYAAWLRFTMFWRYGDGLLPFLRKDPDWPHPERSLNRVNDRHRQEMADYMSERLKGDPALLAQCTPDYPPYGKRILLDNGWFDTLLKDNVELVTQPIEQIESGGVGTCDGHLREADVVVLATGFQVGKMAARLNITGRDGLRLETLWADDNPSAYLGITVAGFPNLFCMLGPNTGLGHGGSAMFQAECQGRYIVSSLVNMLNEGASSMEVKARVQDEFVARVDAEHERMIWTHPGLSTYYRNSSGRVFSLLPWRLVDYWRMTRYPVPGNYDIR